MKKFLMRWLLPLLWAGVIFAYSSLSDPLFFLPESLNSVLKRPFLWGVRRDELLWAVSHFLAYFVLGFLLLRALADGKAPTPSLALMAFGFTLLYGLSDEVHQIFVVGRGFQWCDVLMDALGAGIATGWYLIAGRKNRKRCCCCSS